uniref:Uncharacterized protein n=1 Tax=Cacopsylla melanoneura TaxID=428564 RepID=A0A8D8V0J9_9HEMI
MMAPRKRAASKPSTDDIKEKILTKRYQSLLIKLKKLSWCYQPMTSKKRKYLKLLKLLMEVLLISKIRSPKESLVKKVQIKKLSRTNLNQKVQIKKVRKRKAQLRIHTSPKQLRKSRVQAS